MSSEKVKSPTWFIVLTIIFLLWDLMGVMAFIMDVTMTEEAINALPLAEQELLLGFPIWTKVAYFVAVFGGLVGCVGWLMKRAWSKPVFIVAFVAVLIQMFHSIFIAGSMEVYGPGALAMPIMIIIICVIQIWLSIKGIAKGWLV